ncbi:MAG: phenylalanine--tRNA ligase subunit alpha [Candidatus Micrarchaeia archaeon]
MHRYEFLVLQTLEKLGGAASFDELLDKTGLVKDSVMWALESLAEKKAVSIKRKTEQAAELSEEGMAYAKEGLPEEILLERLRKGNVQMSQLKSKEDQIAIVWLKQKGFAEIQKGELSITKLGEQTKEIASGKVLRELASGTITLEKAEETSPKEVKELEGRHLLSVITRQRIESAELTEQGKDMLKQETSTADISQLTKEIITSKSWQGKTFSAYNLDANVARAAPAREHVLRRLINQIRQAYLANNFVEIKGPIVEPAFWVFDYLFVPQDHPAREMQDTFFASVPEKMQIPEELANSVKKVHEESWHMDWQEEIAKQVVLRTHTTNVTGRYIYKVISALNKNPYAYDLPVKFFTIGRVFRNENLDYKHLADFYQTDGIIIGEDLTLAKLFDTLLRLYRSIGIEVRFRPSYFPFVEPGVEVEMHFGDEWLEMGGAGIIRREIVGSRRKNINVLAWGLGVERIALAKSSRIKSIVELYNENVGWLRNNSV